MDTRNVSGAYRIVSMVILAVCVYFFLLPVISPIMEKLLPNIWTCPFLRITGTPCPFCGITRGLGSIYSLDPGGAGVVTLAVVFIAVAETAFRIMIVAFAGSVTGKTLGKIIVTDIICHLVLVISVSVYVIMYLVEHF